MNLVGETAALSPNAIVRLKSKWESEYRAQCSRKLEECRYRADGVYLGKPEWKGEDCAAMRGGGKGGRSEATRRGGERVPGAGTAMSGARSSADTGTVITAAGN